MNKCARRVLAAAAALATAFASYTCARAETCTLEIKRLESSRMSSPLESLYRSTRPQSFNAQIGTTGKNRVVFGGQDEQAAKFKQIVTKEPQYESDHPFRGVAKFGSHEYAFALDEVLPESEKKAKEEEKKSETDDAKTDAKDKKAEGKKSLAGTLLEALSAKEEEDAPREIKAFGFNRLYFDFNHNGDLTDDKVIEARDLQIRGLPGNYRQFEFPRVELTIDADGTPVDYAFLLRGYINISRDFAYAGVQINAAAYREGDITLDGKTRHVVLIDFNSNGRFDDEIKISANITRQGGALYPEQGDMLLVDPGIPSTGYMSPYDVTSNSYQHYVSKMVDIDGKYFNLKITPAGDKLTLEPASALTGKITNPNGHFNAVIYGDNGFLKISGEKDKPLTIPVGQWKLLSYTLDMTNAPEPAKDAEKEKKGDEKAAISALGLALEALLKSAAPVPPGRRFSYVTANATAKYKPVTVSEGETVEFPFGPPYKPIVSVDYVQGGTEKQASLGMTLMGSVGEVVSDMMVNGARPGKPEFTIKDPKGDVAQSGSFEYG